MDSFVNVSENDKHQSSQIASEEEQPSGLHDTTQPANCIAVQLIIQFFSFLHVTSSFLLP